MSTIDISAGTIHYEATGPENGRPVVFVHGYMMGGQLWRQVSERLAARGLRCIAPTWPLGAHPEPLRRGADRTITGVAAMVAEALAALNLEDVVLVGNDTGGVITQLVAVHHRERLGALVLTSCDAFEHFPPPILKPVILAAKSKTTFRAVAQAMRVPTVRKRAFDGLTHRNIDDLTELWVRPAQSLPAVAEDLRQFTLSMRPEVTTTVAARLYDFDKPTLVAWSADDLFFEQEDGARLAATIPNARLEVIAGARTFSMVDQPDRLADLLSTVAVRA
ncbi:alpha/beta hydrolase [Mycobacterium intracellulare subsp. intracellulare]|uniref:Hydrolase, alpha/beta hydrolase fold family protein n=1 Tax=Mycobacterium intracellulare (strain ATCC 13950 / DSM 43223 / JCM 6384 / NCTC 13025 / 3600) TaxID=487521 RepID=H8IKL9_MYCIA|nr:alpha/beta hydrolase [Mycobacterium intracellulare]AFC46305.1 hydrolase, alpha/beta hydrolase fold family protein [Mycobacterium intracellulare ATCC 13950]UGU06091.1 alpha/beta hydrolase [Mycobacterium intracellulare subsp. intracellulare]UQC07322.1 alpha/beta hydrolase [Mycobacterium intracellulare ATCC 13950]BCO59984.1 oxidoreductase [Mycobacterium intracellulare]BCO97164.1 oxidoreductase [Mycobacterium intracellulare]